MTKSTSRRGNKREQGNEPDIFVGLNMFTYSRRKDRQRILTNKGKKWCLSRVKYNGEKKAKKEKFFVNVFPALLVSLLPSNNYQY